VSNIWYWKSATIP